MQVVMPLTAKQELEHGASLLVPLLGPYGFVFAIETFGNSSGGPYAVGKFTCGSRIIWLHHRQGLGHVVYQIDNLSLEHEQYLGALGVAKQSRFLWLPKEAGVERYDSLRQDLERYLSEFLTGSAEVFFQAAKQLAEKLELENLRYTAEMYGDVEKRQAAREAFRQKRYAEVLTIIDSIRFPQLLTASERMLVDIARRSVQ